MATQEHVRKQFGEVEENKLRLEKEKSEQIIDALNQDLADAYTLYHQLKKHHWNVEGAEFRDLHLFLGEAAGNVEAAADEIAERAQALGGAPIAGGAEQAEHASVEYEGQDVYDIRTSLHNDLEMYGDVIESLRDHIELAENLGDHATAQILREILVETEEDAHHIEHYLEDDTLVVEGAMD
ncbi:MULTISPECIES: DNA starvation/stationary phase protection protein DpsA [Haloarcula]|uniref:DNA starvation/stationary phase protection protein n=1 Tax=Haloarcula pellucida TaxID=1427151 RepID=A0A830GJW2_9EURY|nr:MULTISPECIES: DNA starvation/stationary phase protection protein DpsA [Halomicroarcula]MBX0347509.1 DNA starvation/stationary phase protection protein [Halomicroarcula pellucida]MDS0276617.1 DNA starvation/stationary phase protection protein [Halomicroarcula sp. S1AR25-4]GGN89018.1 DNA starvation/stationary phase protection protein [Halomicroarcula pellucida]